MATHRIYFGGTKMAEVTISEAQLSDFITHVEAGDSFMVYAEGATVEYWIRANTIDAITSIAPAVPEAEKPVVRLRVAGGVLELIDGVFSDQELAYANVLLEKYREKGLTVRESIDRIQAPVLDKLKLEIEFDG